MKRRMFYILGVALMVSGVLVAGEETSANSSVQVREVIRTHDTGYDRHEPGVSDKVKTRHDEARNPSPLMQGVVHIPKQEVSDAE